MMKLKTIALVVCSLICAGATWTAVDMSAKNVPTVSAAEDSVDVSEGVSISGWTDSAELKLLTISFDKNVLSNFDYDAMDTDEFRYIQNYLVFNGRTVAEINADENLGALNWEYTQFPGNASDKYKVPVLIYERDSARLRLYIHKNFLTSLGDSITFEIKEGLTFINEGVTYEMGATRRFAYNGSEWLAAKEEKDITANVVIDGWKTTGSAGELTYTKINFGAGVLPSDLGYHVLDSDIGTHYHYIKDYITVNGKTVGEINAETDVSSYVFSSFPSTAADKYKLPIILYGNGDNLEVKIHNNYVATLGSKVVIGVKAGLYFDGAERYKVTKDVTKNVSGVSEVDVTASVEINGWDTAGDADELTYTRVSFGAGVLPEGIGYGIIDKAEWQYLQEYITINGKTVKEINATTDVSSYVFSTFPSNANAIYKIPVMVFENNGKLEIKVHNDYIATLGEKIVIGVKAGASIKNESAQTVYVVSSDVEKVVAAPADAVTYTATFMDGDRVIATVTYAEGDTTIDEPELPKKAGYTAAWEKYELTGNITVQVVYTPIEATDITASVEIHGWDITGDADELTYTRVSFGAGVLPEGIGYGIIDRAEWQYLQEYITINGKTVKEINTTTDVSNYVFSTFPSTADAIYKIPVIVYANKDKLEIKVHNDYIASLGADVTITIGVKAGATVINDTAVYTVSEDVTAAVRVPAITVDVTANVVIGGWKMIGDLSELTRTIVTFGEGVMPANVDYGIMDNAKYGYLQDYFTINGKTIREINETTDVSGYVFHTFPSTAADKYKVPVILFVNGDNVEFKIHNDYLASLGGNIDVIVGVKAGLSIENGSTTYTVSEDVVGYVRRKAYTFTVEMNPGVDEQYLTVGTEIALGTPEKEHYTFVGWFEKGTDNEMLTAMPERDYTVYAKYEAIEYTVTFMDGDTVVDTVSYTLDNTAITEPTAPTKEGYTSAWEKYSLTGGNVTVQVVYTEIVGGDSSDDSSNDSSNDNSSDSSDDIIDDSSTGGDITDDSSSDIPDDSSTGGSSDSGDDVVEEDSTEDDGSVNSKKSGCFGTISGVSAGVFGLLAAAVLLKKKEDE